MDDNFPYCTVILRAREILGGACEPLFQSVCYGPHKTRWDEDYRTLMMYPEWADAMMLAVLEGCDE